MKLRTDVPAAALPRRPGALPLRFDVTAAALPSRGGLRAVPSPPLAFPLSNTTAYSVATEWLGRIAAVVAVVLCALVVQTIHKGRTVQASAHTIVHNFHTTNGFFATRGDLNDPARVRQELQTLAGVLTKLNAATGDDVSALAATLPNVRTLLAAGQGDVAIAQQLQGVGTTLQGSAASLQSIAANANVSVSSVDDLLTQALDLVGQLNAQLAITQRKLAILPATGANAK